MQVERDPATLAPAGDSAPPAAPPPRRSSVGALSLAAAVAGALTCRVALAVGPDPDPLWLRVLAAGFEAAMVGGIADWFAVTALFRHPLGIPIPHTALIVERRSKLIAGIVATVEDEWLSPEVIAAKLAAFAPSAVVIEWLRDPEHVARLGAPVRDVLRGAARLLTEPEVIAFTERALRRELGGLPIAAVGRWLTTANASASAQAAFTSVAVSIANLADRPRTARNLRFWLERSAATLRAGGKRLVPLLLRRRLVQRKLVEAICSYAAAELRAAAVEAAHPLRRAVFRTIGGFGARITAGDAGALAQAEAIRRALIESMEADPLVRSALVQLRRQIEDDLVDDANPLSDLVDRRLRTAVVDWLDDPERRARFDQWVRTMSQDLLRRHHHQIGRTVRDYLDNLKDAELVERIEARVGSDLQYIRLNGAVIGGLIGILLAVLHAVLGY